MLHHVPRDSQFHRHSDRHGHRRKSQPLQAHGSVLIPSSLPPRSCTGVSSVQRVIDPLTGKPGLFCAKAGYCEHCSFCHVDATDSVDNVCPMSYCAGSGRHPQCISAAKLAAGVPPPCCSSLSYE